MALATKEQKPLGVRHSELLDEIREVGGEDLASRADDLIGELRAETQDEAVANMLGGKMIEGTLLTEDGKGWGPLIRIPLQVAESETKERGLSERPLLDPLKIPQYFGGEFRTDAEYRWKHAMDALEAVAKARPDSALAFVAFELEGAMEDRIFEASQFAESIGRINDPDLSAGADEWTDEQYEAVTGRKPRVKS